MKQAKKRFQRLYLSKQVLSENYRIYNFPTGFYLFLGYALSKYCVVSIFLFCQNKNNKNWSSCISLLSFFNVNFDSFSPAVITTTMNMMKMIKKMKKKKKKKKTPKKKKKKKKKKK